MQEEQRFREIFRKVHRDHLRCVDDEWLDSPCMDRSGKPLDRPIIWSWRNGPWHRVEVLIIGAAPGNAGGRGRGELGAHGTRIPFGGDIAGANLEVMLGSMGLDRNDVFIVATLNSLPDAGGGEPTLQEILRPVGAFPNSLALLRATLLAAGPKLILSLGNLGARATLAAIRPPAPRLPSLASLERLRWRRGGRLKLERDPDIDPAFREDWAAAWNDDPLPTAVWVAHPSAQNMSPYAGKHTVFHKRMLEALRPLRAAARDVLGRRVPARRPPEPRTGIYALPEWRERIAPRNAALDQLWREKGV